jgi:hypothetical protein
MLEKDIPLENFNTPNLLLSAKFNHEENTEDYFITKSKSLIKPEKRAKIGTFQRIMKTPLIKIENPEITGEKAKIVIINSGTSK